MHKTLHFLLKNQKNPPQTLPQRASKLPATRSPFSFLSTLTQTTG